MATITFITTRRLPKGVTRSASVSVPPTVTHYQVRMDTTALPVSTIITAGVEFTTDGGVTWVFGGGAQTNGGDHFAKDGVTPALPGFAADIPPERPLDARAVVDLSAQGNIGVAIEVT